MFKSKSRANLTDFLNQIQQIYSNEKPKKTILLRSIPVLNSSKSLLMVQSAAVEPDPDDPPAPARASTSASASAGRVHTQGETMSRRDFEKLKRHATEVRLLPPLLLLLLLLLLISSFPHPPPPPPPCSSGYGGCRMSFLQQHHRSWEADEELSNGEFIMGFNLISN